MLQEMDSAESRWFAIYTRSRHEKQVAEIMSRKEVSVFLPLRRVKRRWKDRWKEIDIPLFSSYVFVKMPVCRKTSVLQTKGVVNFISNQSGPIPIPDQQIEAIQKLVTSGLKYDPYPYLKEGMRVSIVRGPLAGLEGILLGRRKQSMLVLSVDLIQQSAALQIDITDTDISV